MLSKTETVELLSSEVKVISSRYNIKFILLAGSVARSENHEFSDIDIFISFPEYMQMASKERFEVIGDINISFSNVIENSEVKVIETLPLVVQFNVVKDGIILIDNDPDYREKYTENLMTKYYDFKIFRDRWILSAIEDKYNEN